MKKIMLCINMSSYNIDLLMDRVQSLNLNDQDELHLVSGIRTQVYADNFLINTYPKEEDHDNISKEVEALLSQISTKLNTKAIIKTKCLISISPKDALKEYSDKNSIQHMLVTVRKKGKVEKLFNSSFADYMLRNANMDLTIYRE